VSIGGWSRWAATVLASDPARNFRSGSVNAKGMRLVQTPAELRDFPDFVGGVMARWHVPGVAVAIARNGELVLCEGFGLRDVARGLPVTSRSLFAIGSATKAFTTMGLALLADEGKVDWDTPVRRYLPSFALHDPFASERITPRDLVTHRSGLPRHDALWYGGALSRAELVDRLRYLEPSKDFRAVWQYQNLMYMTAGYLTGELAGTTWEGFVQERIFDRLGMGGSNFSVTRSQQAEDAARPYREKDGQAEELPFRDLDAVGPAGSINSNAEDMVKWLLLHLNRGRHDGEAVVSEGQIAQMQAPQMVMPDPAKYAELSPASYGLGWFVQTYRGHSVVHHGGNIDGFSALVSLLPREKIGVVVLTNLNGVPVPEVVALQVYDRLLGLPEISWDDRFFAEQEERKQAGERGTEKAETDRVKGTHPSHDLDAYAGDYAHPGYGVAAVERRGDGLSLRFNAFEGPLRHLHYDVFDFTIDLFETRFTVSFATDVRGDIASFATPLEPTVPDVVFLRRPGAELTEPSFLSRFAGTFEVMGMRLTVALKGERTLQVSLPGQPDFELEPVKGTGFRLKGLSGFAIEFTIDETGAVVGALLTQPNGVFTARKTG
jgi:CubicO group peptidase (beta-lactamase class C family)